MIKPGTVVKSPAGWERFRDKTDNGARKRPAVAHPSFYRVNRRGAK